MKKLFKKLTKRLTIFILAIIIIGGPILYLLSLNSNSVKAAWFDDNWAYRKAITVTVTSSSSDITNLQTLLTVDTSTDMSGKIQSACQDLRFTSVSGKLLPYYIDSGCTGTTSKIWVLADLVPKNTTTYTMYMYYGNPTAPAGTDATKFDNLVGLKGYWPMNESSGATVKDLSVTANNGTATGTTVTTHTNFSNARTFPGGAGDTDYITVSDHANLNPTTQITIEAWVYQAASQSDKQIIIKNMSGGNGGYRLTATTGGKFHVGLPTSGFNNNLTTAAYSTSAWHHVALTYDGANMKIYVDGQLDKSAPRTGNIGTGDGTTSLYFGRYTNDSTNANFNGNLDEVKIYNTARTAAQITADYNNTSCGGQTCNISTAAVGTSVPTTSFASEETTPGPIAYWKFDEGTGAIASDATSSRNNGTISGAAWQTEDQCVSGKCLSFDGSNDVVTVSNTVSGIQTVSLWIKPITTSEQIIDINGTASISVSSGTISATSFTSPTIYVNGKVSSTLVANSWQYVTVTTGTALSGSAIKIGQISTNYGQAFIDDVKLYPYARTAAQVLTDYNSRGSVKGGAANLGNIATNTGVGNSYPIAYYTFDDGSGSSVQDRSGNGSTGTWVGTNSHWAPGKFGGGGSTNVGTDYVAATLSQSPDTTTVSFWAKDTSTNIWHYYTNSGGTQYVDGIATSFTNKYYYLSGSTLLIGTAGVAPNDSLLSFGLKLWLKANAITGLADGAAVSTWTDLSSAGANLTGSGGARPVYKTGIINNLPVVRFDGTDDRLETTNAALVNVFKGDDLAHTFITVFKKSSATSDQVIFGATNYSLRHMYYASAGGGGNYTVSRYDGATNPQAGGGTPNTSAHVRSATFTGTIQNQWIDGSLITTNANLDTGTLSGIDRIMMGDWYIVANAPYNGDVAEAIVYDTAISSANRTLIETYLGCKYNLTVSGSSGCFTGVIDDFKVYSYARTQAQIIQDMNAGHPAVGSPVSSTVARWRFDEGYGTTANNVGIGDSSMNGTLSGFASPATSTSGWTDAGKFGKALILDGSNDFVNMGNAAGVQLTTGTITAWIKTSGAGSTYRGIVVKQYAYGMFLKDNVFMMYDWTASTDRSSGVNIGDGLWHHVACTFQSGVTNGTLCYIDGKLRLTTTITVSNQTQALVMGAGATTPTQNFLGTIDEPKVYSYVLTADQVKLDMNSSSAQSFGATGNNSSYQPNAANQEYCIPGDTTSCAAPVGRWDFDDASGTSAQDRSGNANTGTLTNSPTWSTGKVGSAISMSGGTEYTDVPTRNNLDITTFTVEGWVYLNDVTATDQWIIWNAKVGANWGGWGLAINRSSVLGCDVGEICFWISPDTGSFDYVEVTHNLTQNKRWYHIAATWNNTTKTATYYVDGKSIGSATSTSSITFGASPKTYIGDADGLAYSFNGKIDQLRVFNYIRTPAQIAWDYNRGAPIGHWRFDECQGDRANDSSGNNNNGTITVGASGTYTSLGTCTSSSASTMWYNGATGKYNGSLAFDATDDQVIISNSSTVDLTNNALTLSAWVKWSGGGSQNYIIDKNSNKYNLAIGAAGAGRVRFYVGGTALDSPTAISSGVWHHLVGTNDGSTNRLYIDGIQVNSNSRTPSISAGGNLIIGCYATCNATYSFDGQIDDVQIYNYAITATQVKGLYNGGAVRFGPSTGAP